MTPGAVDGGNAGGGEEFDVVVVGSGAAGMTAALRAAHSGLSTVVVEKAAAFGGSTARSGGGVWVPGNDALRRAGVADTPEEARDYLRTIVGDVADPDRIDAYLERGPEVLRFVERTTPLRLAWVRGYSDYYPEALAARWWADRPSRNPSTPGCSATNVPASNGPTARRRSAFPSVRQTTGG